jgi:hypothetical protein
VIHLALEVLAFIFLASLGLAVLGGIAGILRAIGGALSKTSAPAPKRQAHSKTRFALGHDPIEPNHDSNACPICREDEADLYARAPRGLSTGELLRWVGNEREKLKGEIKHIPGAPWGDPSSYVWASTLVELEQARDDLQKREMQRRESETQAAHEQERKQRDDERREQEAREFLNREAARVIKEWEERQVLKKDMMQVREDPINQEYRALMQLAGEDGCKCGIEGCPGHEAVNGKIFIDNHPLGPIVIDVSKRKPEE